MNAHALGILELDRALAVVAERAGSALGAERIRSFSPSTDRDWLRRELARVAAVRSLLGGDQGWGPEAIPDVRGPLRRLRVEGASWTAAELLGAAQLLRSARRTVEELRDPRRPAVVIAVLGPLLSRIFESQELERAIGTVIDDDGSVRDDASPVLRRVRRELRGAHGELIRLLERDHGAAGIASVGARHVGHAAQRPLRDSGAARGAR